MTYDKRKVTIVVLAKDEAEGLKQIILSVKKYATRILVIDGHSHDNTRQITLDCGAQYLLDDGKGRGAAVRQGLARVLTPYTVLFDADGSYDARDIPILIAPLIQQKAHLVLASRHTGGSFDRSPTIDSLLRTVGSDIAAMLINKRFGSHFTDVHNGFRALATKQIRALPLYANDHAIEQELVIAALVHQYRVIEVPSREYARAWGESKLKTYMGCKMFVDLLYMLYLRHYNRV